MKVILRLLVVWGALGAIPTSLGALQSDPGSGEAAPPGSLEELAPVFEENPEAAIPLLLAGARELDDPRRANRWIELARLLQGMEAEGGRQAGLAAAEAEEGATTEAVARLAAALEEGASDGSGAGLAALAALLADDDPGLDGARFRRILVEEHLEAPEGPEAVLLLARARMEDGSAKARDDARGLLEELVVSRPNHPLVPEGRRLLEELSGGGV